MKRGKNLLLGIFLVSMIMISISFVSANWFTDFFKVGQDNQDLGGESHDSFNVNLEVTGGSNPEIVYISKMKNVAGTEDHDLANDCVSTTKYFDVYVYADDLSGFPTSSPANTKISVTVTKGTDVRSNHGTAQCTYLASPTTHNVNTDDMTGNDAYDNTIKGSDTSLSIRAYRCPVVMNWYDDTTGWSVTAYAETTDGTGKDGKHNGISEIPGAYGLLLPSLSTNLNSLTDTYLTNTPLDFGTVTSGLTDLNVIPIPVNFRNCGNTDFSNIKLTPQDIPRQGGGSPFVVNGHIFYDPSASGCSTSKVLSDNTVYSLNPAILLINGPSSLTPVRICLDSTAGVTAATYTTVGSTDQWLLENVP